MQILCKKSANIFIFARLFDAKIGFIRMNEEEKSVFLAKMFAYMQNFEYLCTRK
jgi:hypothetical protein